MSDKPALSAIICTHNPRTDYLEETLSSIRAQSRLPDGQSWELIVVDNASMPALADQLDLSWHPAARVIREERLGLSHARLRSFHEAQADILIYIDDDNVLDRDYFRLSLAAFDDPLLGAAGGKSIPRWEVAPPAWFDSVNISLACRDLGDQKLEATWSNSKKTERVYPHFAPVGAGMVVRRSAYASYVETASNDAVRLALGRRGADLSSGEDNDMVMSILAGAWKVAYLPELVLEHLIPEHRLSVDYLERYAQSSNRTWVQVLAVHGIRPWSAIPAWTVPLRKARAWARLKAWKSDAHRIRWKAVCGSLDGRATLLTERDER